MIERIAEGRRLRANHSTAYPVHLLFLDTETTPEERPPYLLHRFRLGWTCYQKHAPDGKVITEDWRLWRNTESLCAYIETRTYEKTTLYIYGHNVFFDLQACGFMHYFPRWGWTLDFLYDKGLVFILCVCKSRKHIKAVSTTNFYEYSLAKLGEDVGLPKLDVDFHSVDDPTLSAYCRRDVEITIKALQQYMDFNRVHDTGKFSLTRASQAFSAYRHRFMDEKVFFHDHEKTLFLERDAYFGGRTECFFIGEPKGGPFLFLDVHSMYPYVMRTFRYPRRLLLYDDRPTLERLAYYLPMTNVIARVKLSTDEPVYPLRLSDKVCFPIGSFTTTLCTGALQYALEHGHIKKIYRMAVYETAHLFSSYIDTFYPLKARYKAEGNVVYERIVKIFLNSLYGKWGQKQPIQITLDANHPVDPYRIENIDTVTGQRWMETHLFGKTLLEIGEKNAKYTLCAIAAEITERARLVLWSILRPLLPGRVLYCDTDSVVLRAQDLPLVRWPIDDSRLGALGLDRTSVDLRIHGLKDYETDTGRTTKGVPASAAPVGVNAWRYDSFLGAFSHLALRCTEGVLVRPTTKVLVRTYDKGIVHSDGLVTPFVLG